MLQNINKNVLWVLLSLLPMMSQLTALQFEPYIEGQPRLKSVMTRFTNNTSHKLFLMTSAIDLADRTANKDLYPVGRIWVEPGETKEEKNIFLISYQTGYIFLCGSDSECSNPKVWPRFEEGQSYLTISLFKESQEVGQFIIDIIRKPVPIFIWGSHIKTPDEDKDWTAIMYDLDIIVTEKVKEEL